MCVLEDEEASQAFDYSNRFVVLVITVTLMTVAIVTVITFTIGKT